MGCSKTFLRGKFTAIQTQIKTRFLCLKELEKEQTEPKVREERIYVEIIQSVLYKILFH